MNIRDYILIVEAENISEKYSADNSYLLQYMKNQEFDPYTHWYEVCQWLEDNDYLDEVSELLGEEVESGDDLQENYEPDVFYKLPKEVQKECAESVIEDVMRNDPAMAPTWAHASLNQNRLLPRETWLVHFTDHAYDVAEQGFTIGIDQMDRLGLTTYFKNDGFDKRGGGYNFAFIADSSYAKRAAHEGKYGKNAVIFQNSGVIVRHYGDEEDQVIFMGKDVDPRDIIVLNNYYGDWQVIGSKQHNVLFTGDFKSCVQWVEKNFNQYRRQLTRR